MGALKRNGRFLVFILAVFGWSCCFFCQRTLPSAIGYMTASLHAAETQRPEFHGSLDQSDPVFTKEEYGRLQNIFVVAYSISILFSGFLSDHINPRILFFLSMGMSGMLCAAFPLTTGNTLLCSVVWFCFGIFEGCGWPATAKIVKGMYTPTELGMWWSFLSCSSNVAATISPVFISYLVRHYDWQSSFYITGLTPVLFLLPLASIMGVNGDVNPKLQGSGSQLQRGHRWYKVFLVPTLQLIIIVYIILWVAKGSVNNWMLLYLQEVCQQCMLLS